MSERLEPYWQQGLTTLYAGDCRAVMRQMELESVQVVCCSPPYFGLRSYGTEPQIWGGDPLCQHEWQENVTPSKHRDNGSDGSTLLGTTTRQENCQRTEIRSAFCSRCGAWRGELGNEPTVGLYVEHLVEVFREVKRILRKDGTLWLNLGSSYSSGVGSNVLDCLNSSMKGRPLFFGNATTIGITSHRGNVPLHNDGPPKGIFFSLLGVERVTVKQRNNDFCQVFYVLNTPGYCWVSVPVCFAKKDGADLELVIDAVDHVRIVISNHDPDVHPVLTVLGASARGAGGEGHASFAIEEPREPIAEVITDTQSIGNPVPLHAPLKRFPDVYLVNQSIPFRNTLEPSPCSIGHFTVIEASEKQLALLLDDSGVEIRTNAVSHLFLPNEYGSLVHYQELYDKAIKKANACKPKQELNVPGLVRQALVEDGWICRSELTGCKVAPMPESVTDRPTSATEKVFLLTKASRYYYDHIAVAEPTVTPVRAREKNNGESAVDTKLRGYDSHCGTYQQGRNLRNWFLWTPDPFFGAHFAVMPSRIPEIAILAGSSARGACAQCGAPWKRVVERVSTGRSKAVGKSEIKRSVGLATAFSGYDDGSHAPVFQTLVWSPTCQCEDAGEPVPCLILDPFAGSGTTLAVAQRLGRRAVGIDLNPDYVNLAINRNRQQGMVLGV